jgi:AGCS family alanine or glycine:cation symporter
MRMLDLLNQIDAIVWGPWLLVLLVGTGVYLTIRLRLLQMVKLPRALRLIFFARNKGDGDIDSFKALCTALAATVGTGNIVGVATAIKLGGPGALFWMWVAAFFGMATKYAEGCLAVKFRSIDENGNIAGGPMYYIEQGLGKKWKPLALAFAFFGTLTAMLGSGTTTQVNAITSSLQASMGVPILPSAAVITILVAIITFGGLKSISKTAEKIVPAMAVLYFIITVALLVIFSGELPHALALVFDGAFEGTAAAGGFAGAGIMLAMRSGIARGLFSNEAGLGSAAIASAAAQNRNPVRQALISSSGPFWDTVVICALTGIVLTTSILAHPDISSSDGPRLTTLAFSKIPYVGSPLLTVSLVTFVVSTILGWSYFGEKALEYLGGIRLITPYRVIWVAAVFTGCVSKIDLVWVFADCANGLMALPNLISLLALSGVLVQQTRYYLWQHRLDDYDDSHIPEGK